MCDKQSVVNQIIRMTSLRRFSALCVCCTHVCAWRMKLHTQKCCGCKWEPEVNFKCFLQLLPDSFRSQDISLHLGDGQVEWSAGSRIPLSLSSQHWAYKCVLLHLIFFFLCRCWGYKAGLSCLSFDQRSHLPTPPLCV